MTEGFGAWVASAWPDHDWAEARMHHGAFHQVAVSGDVVARVASGKDHKQRVGGEALALRQVAAMDLPFDMPRLLSGPITIAGGSGILTTRVFGQQVEAALWSAVCDAFRTAIDALHQVPARRGAGLPSPRTWCGGRTWPDLVEGRLASHLPIDAARRAVAVVSDVLKAEQASPPTLVHGDFGLHNLFWESGRVSGVIDFDHACIPPAELLGDGRLPKDLGRISSHPPVCYGRPERGGF